MNHQRAIAKMSTQQLSNSVTEEILLTPNASSTLTVHKAVERRLALEKEKTGGGGKGDDDSQVI